MYGPKYYEQMAMMGRNYLAFQKMRMAAGARVRRFRTEDKSAELVRAQLDYIRLLTKDEKHLLKVIVESAKDHELWHWCEATKGLGPMACATFLSFINPFKAETGGQSKAYWGLIPGAELKAGVKANWNTNARGRAYVIVQNLIRAQDPFYSGLYYQKKAYYMERMGGYLENPEACPDYKTCMAKLQGRAHKDHRAPKNPPCKAHIDNRAKRWLAGLVVSHATEVMRHEEGLDIESFHRHHGYIGIPPH